MEESRANKKAIEEVKESMNSLKNHFDEKIAELTQHILGQVQPAHCSPSTAASQVLHLT